VAEDRFRALFDHSSDAHLIFDETGITDCNDAAIRLLGARDRAEILALHPAVLSPELQPDGRPSAEKSKEMDGIALRRGWHRFEWVHRRLDGSLVPVEVTLNAIAIQGRPAMVVVWHDLTERKRMEAELREANERMRAELEAAAAVQRSLLPSALPETDRVRFAWRFRPCGELAGDLLDVFRLGSDRVGFYVLDVTGHGVAASLLSVAVSHQLSPHGAQSAFRTERGGEGFAEPFEVVRRLNQTFAGRGGPLQLFTIVCGVLDVSTSELRYVCAGNPGPLRVTRDGRVDPLNVPALPVGVLRGVPYEGAAVRLAPGDRVFVYSDGIPEARNLAGEEFGEERLSSLLARGREGTLDECADAVVSATTAWTAPVAPQDDVSLLALEIPAPPSQG
jgi:sigma-B regulation protein RsbU (phosphoserine phosphatase)